MLLFVLLAALGGIASIFFPSSLGGRLVGSSVIIGVACALFIPALPKRDGADVLLLGRVWLFTIALIALGGLVLVWDRFDGLYAIAEEVIVLSQVILAMGFFAAALPLKTLERPVGAFRGVAKTSLAITCASTVLIIGALFFSLIRGGNGPLPNENLFGEWFILTFAGIVGIASASGGVGSVSPWRKVLPALGIIAAVASAAAWQVIVFELNTASNFDDGLALPFLLTGLAIGIALYSISGVIALGVVEKRLIPVIAFFSVALGVLGFLLTKRPPYEWVHAARCERIIAAVWVVEACLTLTVIILWQLGRRSVRPWTITGAEITCPRCGKRSHFATGQSPCKTCGFIVLVAFNDVCCAKCKHDVRGLEPGHPCPECGQEVERSSARYLP